MRIELLEVDSRVFGRAALAIHDFSADEDFTKFEAEYVRKFAPYYVTCRIPVEQVANVHALEARGFNVVEPQIKASIRLKEPFNTYVYPYTFERVETEEKLNPVLEIAGSTFVHDRYTVDPKLPRTVSGERYRQYVLKSFGSTDEAVYRLFDPQRNETLAFKTHRYLGNNEVLLLLGGVNPVYKTLGIGLMNEYFEFNELIRKGIRKLYTHVSAANYPVVNLEIGNVGFRVIATYFVLRKIYA